MGIVSCASLLKRPICTYSTLHKKWFNFKSIMNTDSRSSITTKKQCRCPITLMYYYNYAQANHFNLLLPRGSCGNAPLPENTTLSVSIDLHKSGNSSASAVKQTFPYVKLPDLQVIKSLDRIKLVKLHLRPIQKCHLHILKQVLKSHLHLQKLLLPSSHRLLNNHRRLINLLLPNNHLLLTNQSQLPLLQQPRNNHLCLLLNRQLQLQQLLLPSYHLLLKKISPWSATSPTTGKHPTSSSCSKTIPATEVTTAMQPPSSSSTMTSSRPSTDKPTTTLMN